jgi:hypothetical protein
LYHCEPFRNEILNMKLPPIPEKSISMLSEIQDLFKSIEN